MVMFCRIFVLYFMTLILMPCTDIHAAASTNIGTKHVSSTHDSCPHEKETDFCSPFCVCNCCGQTSLMVQNRMAVSKVLIGSFKDALAFASEAHWPSEYLDRLFHPPKV